MLTYINEFPYFSTEGPIFATSTEELEKIIDSVDGILAPLFTKEHLAEMLKWNTPIVGITNTIEQASIASVSFNDTAIGRLAAEHLINQSYPHYAVISYKDIVYANERVDGFKNTLKSNSLYIESIHTLDKQQNTKKLTHQPELLKWIERLRKPCAIYCIHDSIAIQLLMTCQRAGLDVPGEIALLGTDNDEIIQDLYSTPISSIDPNFERAGWESCRVLKDILNHQIDNVAFKFRIPPKGVIERGTAENHPRSDSYVDQALEIIRNNIGTDFNVNDLMALLPLSRRALERKFQKQVGRTPKQEILYQRMNKVCHLLENTDIPLNEIATSLGFDEQRKLTRQFKQFSGITPLAYRKSKQ